MLHTAAQKGMNSFFIVHRKELIDQSSRAFKEEGLEHGIIAAGYRSTIPMRVQLASVQTLAKRLDRTAEPQLIVWDECHHIAAASWEKIFRRFPDAYHIGLTATPARLDGRGLGVYFKTMVSGPSVSWLIENGFLSKYKLYAPSQVNLEGVHKRMGDYEKKELAEAVDKPRITGSAVEHYKRHADGKRAIVFAVSVEHSKHIVEEFRRGGVSAAHIDGDSETEYRARSIRDFSSGNIQVLSNVELFGEGFDVPAMEVAILLRPTQSLGLYLQQIGRALRPSDGKQYATILDHVGNVQRFGLPDQPREWSLEGREKGKGEYKAPVKICTSCFAAQPTGKDRCLYCGVIFLPSPRIIDTIDGELKEVGEAEQLALKLKWKKEQGMSKSFGQLVELGKQRGYKRPAAWAAVIMKARASKR